MTDVREPRGDDDLDAWAGVIEAVEGIRWPLEDMRRFVERERYVYRLAVAGEEAVGASVAGPSDLAGRAFVAVRVLPEARRRGHGTRLLGEALDHVRALGRDVVTSQLRPGDEAGAGFADRFGFETWLQEVELVRELTGDESEPALPDGLSVHAFAERPDLVDATWELCRAGYADMPLGAELSITREHWLESEVGGPRVVDGLTLVLVEDGGPVAFSGISTYGADRTAAEHGFTVVRPDRRGRGLARLLKQVQAARAARLGIRRLITATQEGNDPMRAVNARLGYVERPGTSLIAAPLALVAERLEAAG